MAVHAWRTIAARVRDLVTRGPGVAGEPRGPRPLPFGTLTAPRAWRGARPARTAALLACIVLAAASRLSADPRLPALFTDHMVLQRGRAIPVWGVADPGEDVTVTLNAASRQGRAGADGRWRIDLPAHDAGGPFTLTVAGRKTLRLRDVLIGDVWVASGQSNMTLELSRASGADAAAASHDRIRLFTVPKATALEPAGSIAASWQPCTPDTAGTFSAVAYYFGQQLHQQVNVPVGLIHTSWPGSAAEEWTAPDALERDARFAPIVDAWQRRRAAWVGGERNPLTFDLQIAAVEFVAADGRVLARQVPLGPSGARAPWRFSWDEAPQATFDWHAGAEPTARLRGELRARDAARVTIDVNTDRSPANLVDVDAVRVRVSGVGSFRLRAMQPSVADGDDYGSEAFAATAQARDIVIPLGSLKQAGWGRQHAFTPAEVTALVIEPLLGADGARPPGGLYNAMLVPLMPYAIQGAIWYRARATRPVGCSIARCCRR